MQKSLFDIDSWKNKNILYRRKAAESSLCLGQNQQRRSSSSSSRCFKDKRSLHLFTLALHSLRTIWEVASFIRLPIISKAQISSPLNGVVDLKASCSHEYCTNRKQTEMGKSPKLLMCELAKWEERNPLWRRHRGKPTQEVRVIEVSVRVGLSLTSFWKVAPRSQNRTDQTTEHSPHTRVSRVNLFCMGQTRYLVRPTLLEILITAPKLYRPTQWKQAREAGEEEDWCRCWIFRPLQTH